MGKITKPRDFSKTSIGPINNTSFKHKLKSIYEKNIKNAVKVELAEVSKRPTLLFLPTPFMSFGTTPDEINRHIDITGSSIVTRMMNDDTKIAVQNKIDGTLHRYTEENGETFFNRYMSAKIDTIFTHNTTAVAQMITSMNNPCLRSIIHMSCDCLSVCSGKIVRVYLDTPAGDGTLLMTVRIAIDEIGSHNIDLGPDVLHMIKTANLMEKLNKSTTAISSVKYGIRRGDIIIDNNDLETESAEEYKRRSESGLPYITKLSSRPLYRDMEKERLRKIFIDFVIKLPRVDEAQKTTVYENIATNRRINSLIRNLI